MSDDTYYTVLDVSESATQFEIKTAYRNLMKQIHPDTVLTLSPELRRTAEDVTKEMIEAYSVLSDVGKRRDYDQQLAEYRRRSSPSHPRVPKAASSPPQRAYASPPTQAPHPRAAASCIAQTVARSVSRAAEWSGWVFMIVVVSWFVVPRVFQQADDQRGSGTDSILHWTSASAPTFRPEGVASYCKTHPTSTYGAPDTSSGVTCSDWAHLTGVEQRSIQAACSQADLLEAATYVRCLARELQEWKRGPKQPDLSRLSSAEYNSIQAACSNAYLEGPSAFDECLVRDVAAWEKGPRRPDLSHLSREKQKSLESACSDEFMQGPAVYDRCLIGELADIQAIYRI
jgi:curved DNA-binding protein CbpA